MGQTTPTLLTVSGGTHTNASICGRASATSSTLPYAASVSPSTGAVSLLASPSGTSGTSHPSSVCLRSSSPSLVVSTPSSYMPAAILAVKPVVSSSPPSRNNSSSHPL